MQLSRFIRSNIGSLIFTILLGFILFNTDGRTLMIKGLMSTGLFNADVSSTVGKTRLIPEGLSFRSESGKIINLSEHKGTVFFINFWTTWCPPCRAEMSSINSLYNKIKNKDKIVFIMVDADNKLSSAVKFMRKNSYQLPVFVSASSIPEEIFNGSLPTTLIIGPDGNLVFQHTGVAEYDKPDVLDLLNNLNKMISLKVIFPIFVPLEKWN